MFCGVHGVVAQILSLTIFALVMTVTFCFLNLISTVVVCPPYAKIANSVKLREAVCRGSVLMLTNFVRT